MKRRYDVTGLPDQQTAEDLDQAIQNLLSSFRAERSLPNPLTVHMFEGWIGMGREAFSPEQTARFVPPASNRAVKKANSTSRNAPK